MLHPPIHTHTVERGWYIAVMQWPGWNDLETIKTVSSRIADITVGFWVAMALLEVAAFFGDFSTRVAKRLAGLGLLAFLFAVSGEVVERKYDHRKDWLYDQREVQTAKDFNQKIDDANAKAQAAGDANKASEQKATDAQKTARAAQAEADALRKQNEPRTLTKEQQQKLSAYLEKCPTGAFDLNASIEESDARPYAEQIASVFRAKNWDIKIHNSSFTGTDITGLWITVQNLSTASRSAVDLHKAFDGAGIPHKVFYDPTMTDPHQVTLSIGFKPKQK